MSKSIFENKVFITMPHGKKNETYFGSAINLAELKGDTLIYDTKTGVTKTKVTDLESCFQLKKVTEFDYTDSLYWWRKKWRNYKEVVFDESITNGEEYRQTAWHFSLLIDATGDVVKVKPLID